MRQEIHRMERKWTVFALDFDCTFLHTRQTLFKILSREDFQSPAAVMVVQRLDHAPDDFRYEGHKQNPVLRFGFRGSFDLLDDQLVEIPEIMTVFHGFGNEILDADKEIHENKRGDRRDTLGPKRNQMTEGRLGGVVDILPIEFDHLLRQSGQLRNVEGLPRRDERRKKHQHTSLESVDLEEVDVSFVGIPLEELIHQDFPVLVHIRNRIEKIETVRVSLVRRPRLGNGQTVRGLCRHTLFLVGFHICDVDSEQNDDRRDGRFPYPYKDRRDGALKISHQRAGVVGVV